MDLLTVLEETVEEMDKASNQMFAALAKASEALQFTEPVDAMPYRGCIEGLFNARALIRKRHARLEQILNLIGVPRDERHFKD